MKLRFLMPRHAETVIVAPTRSTTVHRPQGTRDIQNGGVMRRKGAKLQ